jgi:hypothetical protein
MRRWSLLAGGLVVGLCLVVVAGIVLVPRLRPAEPPATPPGAPAAAVLRGPSGPVTVGDVVEVVADVVAASPLAALQLWAGGTLADEVHLTETRRATDRLRFRPASAGTHLLVLRVVDAAGRVTHAAPVRVRAQERVTPPADGPARPFMRPVAHRVALAGPAVTVTTRDCVATVTTAPDPAFASVALFGLGPGDAGFHGLGHGSADVSVPLTAGENAVYALGFDGHGSAPSDIAMVRAPAECADRRWKGDVSLVEGVLRAPGEPTLAYLYLTVDGGPWRRVPAADQTNVARDRFGQLDFGPYLPSLEGAKAIEIEAWTRRDGRATLLGRGSLTAETGQSMPALVGFLPGTPLDQVLTTSIVDTHDELETLTRHGEIHLYTDKPSTKAGIVVPTLGKPTSPYRYRWKPPLPNITHGVWQVSMAPPSTAPTLDQPGLLAFGTVPAAPTDFEIDFRPLVLPDYQPPAAPPKTWTVDFSTVAPAKYGQTGSGGADYVAVGGAPVAGGGSAGGDTAVQIGSPTLSPAQILYAVKPAALYVRIVPMAGAQPVDAVSNPVTYALYFTDPTPPSNKLPTPPAITVDVDFDRPYLNNPKWNLCVRVVKNPFPFGANPGYSFPAPVGSTHCPYYSDDDGGFDPIALLEGAVGLASDFWNEVKAAFDYLKQYAVQLLVTATGCGTGPTKGLSKDTCEWAATMAVNVALTSLGIPPDLPSSQELFAMAKGEMVDAMYALAGSYGISCDQLEDECKKAMQAMLDEVVEYAEKEVSKAAKAQGGGAILLHPDIVVVPEPRGKLQPAVFRVTYRRTPAKTTAALPTACVTNAYVYGKHPQWSWYDHDAKQPASGPVEGIVFLGNNPEPVNLAALKPGQTVSRLVVLRFPLEWFEPGGDPIVGENDGVPGSTSVSSDLSHYYVLMRHPAVLTATIWGCATKQVDTWVAPPGGYLP